MNKELVRKEDMDTIVEWLLSEISKIDKRLGRLEGAKQ